MLDWSVISGFLFNWQTGLKSLNMSDRISLDPKSSTLKRSWAPEVSAVKSFSAKSTLEEWKFSLFTLGMQAVQTCATVGQDQMNVADSYRTRHPRLYRSFSDLSNYHWIPLIKASPTSASFLFARRRNLHFDSFCLLGDIDSKCVSIYFGLMSGRWFSASVLCSLILLFMTWRAHWSELHRRKDKTET